MNRHEKSKMRLGRLLTRVINRVIGACGNDDEMREAVRLEFRLRDEIEAELRAAWEAGKRGEL